MASPIGSQRNRIKILIVDDSAVMRRCIHNALITHADLEVIGTANNGAAAVAFVQRTRPDIIILDIEMPIMDGIAALREIRKSDWSLPIIMFSSLTQAGTQTTLTALTEGASDYVGKPENTRDVQEFLTTLQQTLIPKIRDLCSNMRLKRESIPRLLTNTKTSGLATPHPDSKPVTAQEFTVSSRDRLYPEPIDAVCIGASTGGPAALVKLFSGWPEPLKIPVFIVQHMPAQFTGLLAKKLTSVGGMPVKEAIHGEVTVAGCAYLAPGGFHLTVENIGGQIFTHLNQDRPENFCRPSVDALFRSAAKVFGCRLLGVVLTGMGSDGMLGSQNIIQAHGQIMAQDQTTSLIWGMPGAVVRAGFAQKILPLGDMHYEISLMASRARSSAQG